MNIAIVLAMLVSVGATKPGVVLTASVEATPRPGFVLAQTAPAPAETEREALLRRLSTFVADDYLGTGRDDHENRPDLYADRVDYYGRASLPRAAVMAGKQAYYRKWPTRRYDMIAGSLSAKPGAGDSVEIAFRYNYAVANGTRGARGIGTTTLGLILREDGQYQIVKETGGIVQRTGGR